MRTSGSTQLIGAKGLVLERSFSSLAETAQRRMAPWPVAWIMRNQYPSEQRIQDYHGPLLQSHGTSDNVVPIDLGIRLFEAAPTTDKKFIRMPFVGHNDPNSIDYQKALKTFLNELNDPPDKQEATPPQTPPPLSSKKG